MILPVLLLLLFLLANNYDTAPPTILSTQFQVLQILPHDTSCFTEGLQYSSTGQLVESCGPIPQNFSSLRRYNSANNESTAHMKNKDIFYEGLTFQDGQLYLLTYKSQIIFKFSNEGMQGQRGVQAETFHVTGTKELWGAASNGTHIFVSNGSSVLLIYDKKLELKGSLKVQFQNGRHWRGQINELQYDADKQRFLANSWFKTELIIFDSQGTIERVVELKPLLDYENKNGKIGAYSHEKCLNGIARDSKGNFVVTGKLFSYSFRISLNDY